jgi:hypothetical protein
LVTTASKPPAEVSDTWPALNVPWKWPTVYVPLASVATASL